MSDNPTENELRFFYFDFFRVLKRYRMATLLGWLMVAAGVASVPLGLQFGRPHGLVDIALAVSAIVAGLIVVQQTVAWLETYVKVPFPTSIVKNGSDEVSPVLHEIQGLMKDVDDGGWQEAYAAISQLKTLGIKHGLPSLEQ